MPLNAGTSWPPVVVVHAGRGIQAGHRRRRTTHVLQDDRVGADLLRLRPDLRQHLRAQRARLPGRVDVADLHVGARGRALQNLHVLRRCIGGSAGRPDQVGLRGRACGARIAGGEQGNGEAVSRHRVLPDARRGKRGWNAYAQRAPRRWTSAARTVANGMRHCKGCRRRRVRRCSGLHGERVASPGKRRAPGKAPFEFPCGSCAMLSKCPNRAGVDRRAREDLRVGVEMRRRGRRLEPERDREDRTVTELPDLVRGRHAGRRHRAEVDPRVAVQSRSSRTR